MKNLLHAWVLLAGVLLFPIGCGSQDPPSLHGAWLGEGKFTAAQGAMDVKAQLEVLADGTYRFLVIEPPVLMMMGLESGTWAEEGTSLALTPVDKPQEPRTGVFGALASAPRDFRPKTLTITGRYSSLSIEDDQFQMTFRPNPEATKILRESGEI